MYSISFGFSHLDPTMISICPGNISRPYPIIVFPTCSESIKTVSPPKLKALSGNYEVCKICYASSSILPKANISWRRAGGLIGAHIDCFKVLWASKFVPFWLPESLIYCLSDIDFLKGWTPGKTMLMVYQDFTMVLDFCVNCQSMAFSTANGRIGK